MIDGTPGAPAWGVLWDMDGTLVDTEPYWFAAEYELVEEYGGTWNDDHAHFLVGSDLLDGAAYIKEHGNVPLDVHEIVFRLEASVARRTRAQIPWRPGARELLAALHAAEVPCALVTMAWRGSASAVLDALPDGWMRTSVTGDEVPEGRGKPHPDPYLKGAALLGLAPAHCIAIEDSRTGARAALAAGCVTIGVPNAVPLDGLDGLILRDTLAGMTPADLSELVASRLA
jgi:HAD superfamily hydrolase (TIGR01509 family)